MTNKIITSALTIVCVLCGGWVSGAFAAPSVRALGGAGTYTGTTSAAAARANGTATASARAGSVRVTPSVKVSSSTTPRSSNTGTKTSTSDDQRMSIGKYLGPSVTGGTKVSNGGATAASIEDFDGLAKIVDELAGQINNSDNGLLKRVNGLDTVTSGISEQIETFLTKTDADIATEAALNAAKKYTDEAVAAATGGTPLPTERLSDGRYYVWDTTGTAPQWRVISIEDTWSDGIPSGT